MSGLSVERRPDGPEPGDRVATERLFLDAERENVVLEDDPSARFLLCAVGDTIPQGYDVPKKAAAKAPNKAADKPDNK